MKQKLRKLRDGEKLHEVHKIKYQNGNLKDWKLEIVNMFEWTETEYPQL